MNSKLIKLLVSVCISLCLVIACELLYAKQMQRRLLTSIISAKPQDYKPDELPEIALTKQPEESYVDLVARPLFIKGRRPVDEPTPEVEQAAAKSDSFDWQLTGVYSTKKTLSALLSRAKSKVAKDNYRRIAVGDDIDGWKLTEINKDKVVLRLGGNEKVLLLRKPKLKDLPQKVNNAIPAIPSPFSIPVPVPAAAPDPATINIEDPPEGNQ